MIDYLKKQLEAHERLKQKMKAGERYYSGHNDILNRRKVMGAKSDKGTFHNVTDTSRANHRLPSGFMRQQVQQKVNYLINDELTVDNDADAITEALPNWKADIKKLAIDASKKIYGVWQWYVKDGFLKYKKIDPEQIVVDFDDNENIKTVIRHYLLDSKEIAELYTPEEKITYVKSKRKWEEVARGGHMADQVLDANGNVVEENVRSWGRPPFSILFNNDELETDLNSVKPYIDIYDITISDFANNIDDFQEIITILKGYGGDDPAGILNQLKKMAAVPIPRDGDIEFKQGIIPVEARKEFLQIIRKNIFEFGMSVDVQNIAAGNATNVAIQSMYENLNMKASQFEQKLQFFWNQTLYFINSYYQTNITADLVFDKRMLNNQKDIAEITKIETETVALLAGLLDDRTLTEVVAGLKIVSEKANVDAKEIQARLKAETDAVRIEE